MPSQVTILIAVVAVMFSVIGGLSLLAHYYTLSGIKSKTVGDGQHGTARFATEGEIKKTYTHVPYEPEKWRRGQNLPALQGLVVGCKQKAGATIALIDDGDIHCLMIGAAGVGKTANFLYPNIEYACASGMSFLCTDTKGDLFRNYAGIAKDYYGFKISVLDLRNPTRSDGDNNLQLVNRYMDAYMKNPDNLALKAKAERYAKITAKTIITSNGEDASSYGQNAFFYDAAEGLLTSVILLIAEYCPPEKRHIISVFKMIQDLLAPSPVKNKSQFQLLMDKLPSDHKAKWFAGAALNTADQAMASVLSTAMSRLNAFLDSEMEQILCFDSSLDTETFCKEKCAIFIILPEEDNTKYFMVSLFLQQLYREMLTVADEYGGKLPKGNFILAKTGCYPMRTKLPLFLKWGIRFEKPFEVEERAARKVAYADRFELEQEIMNRRCAYDEDDFAEFPEPPGGDRSGGTLYTPVQEHESETEPPAMPLRTD